MAVYIDILFLRELLVDIAVLWTTAWVRQQKINRWRLLAAALLGACYTIVMLFPTLSFLFSFLIKVVFSLVMLFIAFGFHSLQHYLRTIAAFYAVNFVAAGAIIGIYYMLLKQSDQVWRSIISTGNSWSVELKFGLFYFFVAFFIGIYLYRAVLVQKREREMIETHLATVEIVIKNQQWKCTGLIDTGNQLYDPLTRTPVMVTEISLWKEDLPANWVATIVNGNVDQLVMKMNDEDTVHQFSDRLRFVPYRGINRNGQFMLALKPDYAVVNINGQLIQTDKILIGLDGGKLAQDGSYQAIIHPAMVQSATAG
ncbi:sigma-E processing peptidase SpoIIGA [Paenibacillus yanchengensis]|uniref:Sigma-E processing peptidase SpoIIGA n=1 Tax=Paenibacillus yanchengensis TaxID=2035833 RepID=A0ABW4YKM1_9BACL